MSWRILSTLGKLGNLRHYTKNVGEQVKGTTGIGEITGEARSTLHATGQVNQPSKQVVTHMPPLTMPLANAHKLKYAPPLATEKRTRVSTLENGMRVASEPCMGRFCTVGVVIDSGSRYEVGPTSGTSHFLEKLAYSSSKNLGSRGDIRNVLELTGGVCGWQSKRETLIYVCIIDRRALAVGMNLLSEVSMRPVLSEEELRIAQRAIRFELENVKLRCEYEQRLVDMIHAAAYRRNTLGQPKLCPPEHVQLITRNRILKYMQQHHTPERMVIAGVGVDHDELLQQVQQHFVPGTATWQSEMLPADAGIDAINWQQNSVPQFTGGLVKEECSIPTYAAVGRPELAHVVIGLESCSYQHADFVPTCVLNLMMGGGDSFSKGGPGKGMYARLYRNVLNHHHWMYSAYAYNHAYIDTGLFCIYASAPPENVADMVEVIVHELLHMASMPQPDELNRAKVQLQSIFLMNLEIRSVVFEDIGMQVLANGVRNQPEYFIKLIEQINADDIRRVAKSILTSPPAVAALGVISKLPTMQEIRSALGFSRRKSLAKLAFNQ